MWNAVIAPQHKVFVSLQLESTCCSTARGRRRKTSSSDVPDDLACDRCHQNKLLLHEATPPTGPGNSRTVAAAVFCVVKHEPAVTVTNRTPVHRGRCRRSESGLASKRFTYGARHDHRQETSSQESERCRAAAARISNSVYINDGWRTMNEKREEGRDSICIDECTKTTKTL